MTPSSHCLDLALVAALARHGARQAVRDEMDARDRYIPSAVGEDWLHIGVVQHLRRHLRAPGAPRFRVHEDYQDCEIGNLACDYPHLIDVVVLYPASGARDHAPAVGVIEIRKDCAELPEDAARLGGMAPGPADEPPLQWVLQLLLLDGISPEQVLARAGEARSVAARFGLLPLGECEPERATPPPDAAPSGERWFDVACYGKMVAPDRVPRAALPCRD